MYAKIFTPQKVRGRNRGEAEKTVYVEKYSYCEHGNLVKTESYVEGEENTSGVNVTEKVGGDRIFLFTGKGYISRLKYIFWLY